MAWTDCHGGKWVAPSAALLPDEACAASAVLAAAFTREGMPLVTGLPPAMLRTWQQAMPSVHVVTPAAVREHLRARGARLALMQLPSAERLQVGVCRAAPAREAVACAHVGSCLVFKWCCDPSSVQQNELAGSPCRGLWK